MILYGEPVDLFLDSAAVLEEQGIILQQYLLPLTVYKSSCPVAVILGHAQYRDLKSQYCQYLFRRCNLPLASVHEDQIRQDVKAFVVLKSSPESSGQHLLKAAVIIRPFNGPYPEPSVVLSYGLEIPEHYHGSYCINSIGVAYVIGLHPVAGLIVAQDHCQHRSEFILSFLLSLHLGLKALGDLYDVLFGKFHELMLVPSLRGMDPGSYHVRNEFSILKGSGNKYLLRRVGKLRIILLDELAHYSIILIPSFRFRL